MISLRKALKRHWILLAIAGCTVAGAFATPQSEPHAAGRGAVSSRDQRAGFGRPETISGTITSIDERGLLNVKREGPSEPPTTDLTVVETRNPNGGASSEPEEVQATPGPGRTDYTFRMTASTLIRINGQAKSLADLAGLQNRRATVHFVPRRSGDFATSVEVGP